MKAFWINLTLLLIFIGAGIWVKDLHDFSQLIKSSDLLAPLDAGDDVDLIVVLTGGQGRFKTGLRLLGRYPKAWLLVSGAESSVTLEDVLQANGVEDLQEKDRRRIWLGSYSKNTEENAVEVRDIALKVRAKKILLVTSSYHARRALELMRREFSKDQGRAPQIFYHSVESPNFPRTGWWRRPIGWKIFLSEYIKSKKIPTQETP